MVLFNIGVTQGLEQYQFGIKIAKKLNLNPNLIIKDNFLNRKDLSNSPLDMRMDISKIKKIVKIINYLTLIITYHYLLNKMSDFNNTFSVIGLGFVGSAMVVAINSLKKKINIKSSELKKII